MRTVNNTIQFRELISLTKAIATLIKHIMFGPHSIYYFFFLLTYIYLLNYLSIFSFI